MTIEDSLATDDAIAGVTIVTARRIGVLADDHNETSDDLPAEVLEAFDGVDLILHLGHRGPADGTMERLEKVAPVLGVRDYSRGPDGNPALTSADGTRVAGLTRVVETGGLKIGAVHNPAQSPGPEIPSPPGGIVEPGGLALGDVLAEKFGGPVDIVAYGGSHRAAAVYAQGVMFVNPGSPNYPKGPGRVAGQKSLGTVGLLEVNDGVAAFEIVELSTLST